MSILVIITVFRWREAQIQSCFTSHLELHYPNIVDNLKDLLDQFEKSRENVQWKWCQKKISKSKFSSCAMKSIKNEEKEKNIDKSKI